MYQETAASKTYSR